MRRRTIVKVIALLAAGTAVNVAVAWGLAVISLQFARVWFALSAADAPRTVPAYFIRPHVSHAWKHESFTWDTLSGYEAWGCNIFTVRSLGTADWHLESTAVVVGWPQPTLWGWDRYCIDGVNVEAGAPPLFQEESSGILFDFNTSGGGIAWIPCLPIWPGFAINTLFYAGVLWMLFAFPFALRRMIRRRRGRCPTCAYPIGTSEVCTECGASVMPAKAGIQ